MGISKCTSNLLKNVRYITIVSGICLKVQKYIHAIDKTNNFVDDDDDDDDNNNNNSNNNRNA